MSDKADVHAALKKLLTEALEQADSLRLEFVAIRIAEAIDQLKVDAPAGE